MSLKNASRGSSTESNTECQCKGLVLLPLEIFREPLETVKNCLFNSIKTFHSSLIISSRVSVWNEGDL